jgi:hypothetical protein
MGKSKPFLWAACVGTAAIWVALVLMMPRMKALHPGTSANFWYAATRVDLGATAKHDLPVFDIDRYVYGRQHPFSNHSDYPYETISMAAAEADFPRVQVELARRSALNDPNDVYAAGYARWASIGRESNRGIPGLLICIAAQRANVTWPGEPAMLPPTYPAEFAAGLMHASRAARLYVWCLVFEALYLPMVLWFLLWPYICRLRLRRTLLHVAAVPLLLALPTWFGYCNSVAHCFPIGGIVYPYFLGLAPRFPENHKWEVDLISSLPPVLHVITQGRAVTYIDYYTFRDYLRPQWFPLTVAAVSAGLMAVVAAGHCITYVVRRARVRPRGFPVLMDDHRQPPAPRAEGVFRRP